MKKGITVPIFLIAVVCFVVSCSQRPLNDDYDIIQSIQAHEHIAGDLRKFGAITENGKLLFLAVAGENEQTYRYYAAEFSIDEDNAYHYVRSIPLNKLAWQCYLCKWQTGYVVLCNNTQAHAFRACIRAGNTTEEIIDAPIDGVPWIYYLERPEDYASYEIEYLFMNSEGKEIRLT